MKRSILCCVMLMGVALFVSAQQKRIYINPGHGSWGPNDRPMATIPYPNLSSGRPDTCGFYESNTNLWKCTELAKRLQKAGYTIKMSRYANGPYPYVSGAADAEKYNKKLSVICAEVDAWDSDMFISVHSNATSDGSMANYPLLLYRGWDMSKSENELVPGSISMAKAIWPYLVEAMKSGMEYQYAYASSMNIRGDLDFYHSSSSYGYLGVLKHSVPGFLSEGYFHTYQPARHRALNQDWCRQEGIRYYRGIVSYFKTAQDEKGYVMGVVKDNTKTMDSYNYYKYKEGTHDAYLPINGATVRLRDGKGNVLGTYKVDKKYNGVFVFYDLTPGTYYLDLKADGYVTEQGSLNKVVVNANATSYPVIYMKPGTSTDFEIVDGTVSVQAEGAGTVSCDTLKVRDGIGKVKAKLGEKVVFTFAADEGSYLEKVLCDGVNVTSKVANGTYTIDELCANVNVEAVFKKYTYTLTLTCGANGTVILPDTSYSYAVKKITVEYGDNIPIKVVPSEGYQIKYVKHNGEDVTALLEDNVYALSDIKKNQRFQAMFTELTGISDIVSSEIRIVPRKGGMDILGMDAHAVVKVMDLSGKMLLNTRAESAPLKVDVPSSGVYIVEIDGESHKVIIAK